MCGRETITFDRESLKIFRGAFGIGWYFSFSVRDVHDIRLGSFLDPSAKGRWEPRFVRSSLVFGYRGKAHCFGREIGETEAQHILKAIREWNPQIVLQPSQDLGNSGCEIT
jgi:hypothetical protein